MRWDRLFADLDAQLEAAERAELAGEVSDRSRREVALVTLAARLRMAAGVPLRIGLAGAGELRGPVVRTGPDWVLVGAADGNEAVVPLDAIGWVVDLPALAEAAPLEGIEARLGLGYALRCIARDRAPVRILLRDGGVLTGTIDRVGADFLDVAEHAADQPRRPGAVRGVRTVTFAGLAAVRPV